MHKNSVPEKLIMERYGRLLANRMHSYECTSISQQKALCNTICGVPVTAAKVKDCNTVEPVGNDTGIKNKNTL